MAAPLTLPPLADVFGWTAVVLTLLTFMSSDMRRLRMTALAANVAFIAYAALAGLWPVLALHLILVPVNLWRLHQSQALAQLSQQRPPVGAAAAREALPAASPAAQAPRASRVLSRAKRRGRPVAPTRGSTPMSG